MKYILILTAAFFSQLTLANSVDITCTDGFYQFEIINYDGVQGEIKTAGNFGDLSTAAIKPKDEQPYQNFTVFTDKFNRKISIANWTVGLDPEGKTIVYFNDIKYNCKLK